jgi:creatinine amidohydrolase
MTPTSTSTPTFLARLTFEEVKALLAKPRPCVLLPVGSVEPHGPHLPLATDSLISETACERASAELQARDIAVCIAPTVPYGVTDYADGFAGAIGVSSSSLTALLSDIVARLIKEGFAHVCIVNNHLEPAHDKAVRAAVTAFAKGAASVACPLDRRHGRTLSAEFKSGACHAGRYETSLVLAASANDVRVEYKDLPPLDLSLSVAIAAGKSTFAEIGMTAAYTGAPADASAAEGALLYDKLAQMIVTEVTEGLAKATMVTQ